MRKCPNCSGDVSDTSTICRNCGGIVEEEWIDLELPDLDPPDSTGKPAEAEEILSSEEVTKASRWPCPKCNEKLDADFDICWKCGTERDGTEHPNFDAETADEGVTEMSAAETVANLVEEERSPKKSNRPPPLKFRPCIRCGSTEFLRNVPIQDQGQGSNGKLRAVVYGDPSALLFKDSKYGELRADICGECGHVDFRVTNVKELYRHYVRTRRKFK